MADSTSSQQRLDSWKAIADYLKRDLATVRRWEKRLGLPVHRVGGSGRSVFAYSGEIDRWLATARPSPLPPPAVNVLPGGTRAYSPAWLALPFAIVALTWGLYARTTPIAPGDLHVDVTPGGIVARDAANLERWRHDFPEDYQTAVPAAPVQVTGGASPGVYFATSYRGRRNLDYVESGVLRLFDLSGQSRRSFSFDEHVSFGGVAYGAPWPITAFAVNDADGSYRVAVTAHHYTWDPGLVTVLDQQWRRIGTFVHAGWIEQVRWLSPDRLMIAGFSNAYDGGMVALLDPAALNGQGPAPAYSRHVCDGCGPDRPLRMFVFPRTEINRASSSPFNRVILNAGDGRISARSIEMATDGGDADALYEFSASFELLSARFSERYWDLHRALEADGRLSHRREQCPDRDGPRQVLRWEPQTGWQSLVPKG